MESFLIHEFGLFLPITFRGEQFYAYADLGANPGGITPEMGRQFPTTGSKTSRGAFGEIKKDIVTIPEFTFLDKVFQDVQLTISQKDNFTKAQFNAPFHIGAREMLSEPLCLDFHRLTASFEPSGELPDAVTVPIEQNHNLILFELTLQGQPIRAILDTGAGISVFNTAHLEELKVQMEWRYNVNAVDLGDHSAEIGMYNLPGLQIADIQLGETEVAQTDLSSIEVALGTRIDLLFGANTLIKTSRTWLINAAQQTLSVSRT